MRILRGIPILALGADFMFVLNRSIVLLIFYVLFQSSAFALTADGSCATGCTVVKATGWGAFQSFRPQPPNPDTLCGTVTGLTVASYKPMDGVPYSAGNCNPDGTFSPTAPPLASRYSTSPFGILENAVVSGAAVLALTLLAGVAALVGAPVLAAVAGATAVTAAIMTAFGMAFSTTPSTASQALASAPISVTLTPSPTVPPAPVAGPAAPPTVLVHPVTGQFVPGGGNLYGGGATGGWGSGATGEWQYTPPATAENPSPTPTVKIADGGFSVTESDADQAISIKRGSDGGVAITHAAKIPGTSPTGAYTRVDAAVTTIYDSMGAKVPGTGESPEFSPVYENGDPVVSGGFMPCVVTATETCGATTTPGTDPTGTGSCTSGDCSTESTQLANKGLLQGIKDLLTDIKGFFTAPFTPDSTGTTPGEQAAAENKKITDMLDDSVGSYNNFKLLDWSTWVPQLPAAGCSPITGHVMGKPITIDFCAKVAMLNELIGWLLSVFALWSVVSMLFRKD